LLGIIGRVVYFVAWMFVMLLPKVIQLKGRKKTQPLLMKYVPYCCSIYSNCFSNFSFPETVVNLMFGKEYLSIAFIVEIRFGNFYFAIANIFAYYFLSINQYIPVVVSAIIG
jgi:hypothetical protein